MRLRRFEDHLHEKLRDPEYAVVYLETALEDSIEEFLYALREVACAQEGGLQHVAQQAKLGRESMYKSLSREGNPRIKTLDSIIDAIGLQITISKGRRGSRHGSKPSSEQRESACA